MQVISASEKVSLKLIANTIFFAALIILVSVLPFSEFIISVSQFTLAGAWLLSNNLISKLHLLKQNKLFWVLSGLVIIHLAGLLYTDTENFNYAAKDLRIKVPLLLLPLLFASSNPLTKKQFVAILQFFIAAVFTATVYSLGIKLGWWGNETLDSRKTSVFISHIRFALMICFAFFISIYFLISAEIIKSKIEKTVYVFLIIWFCFIIYFIPLLTGAILLPICLVILFFIYGYSYCSKPQKLLILGLLAFILTVTFLIFNHLSNEIYLSRSDNLEELDKATALGNPYTHEPENSHAENRNRVWTYVCWEELEQEWNKRSGISLDEKDLKNQDIRFTLIRFLSSKGLRKDAEGVKSLSSQEINAIQNGIANVNFIQGSTIYNRLYQIVWEYYMYKKGLNPSGHSIFMRYEYSKVALHIIKQNLLIGIGTGNIVKAYENAYKEVNTKLEPRFQRRTHNQYLTFMICFGIFGFLYFIFSLAFPLAYYPNHFRKLYVAFMIIILISMLTEDTLETQIGVTFYAFFNSLFLFLAPKKETPLIS